jgi:hypothetical protein
LFTVDLVSVSELERAIAPALDVVPELLVSGVVELELLAAEPAEPGMHVGQN